MRLLCPHADPNHTNHGIDPAGHTARGRRSREQTRARLVDAGLHDGGNNELSQRGIESHSGPSLFGV